MSQLWSTEIKSIDYTMSLVLEREGRGISHPYVTHIRRICLFYYKHVDK